jgi:hypothetical protein
VEGAITNHATHSVSQIQYWSEAKVDATTEQLTGHQPTNELRILVCPLMVSIKALAQASHWRKLSKSFAKTLHPSPLLIHCNQ